MGGMKGGRKDIESQMKESVVQPVMKEKGWRRKRRERQQI